MGCCFPDTVSVDEARTACKEALFDSVTSQITNADAPPTLIDAIPTIGKTSAAAKFGAELCEGERDTKLTYLTHRTENRRQFEEKVRHFVDHKTDVDVTHLPVLEDDCSTASGNHGDSWKNRLLSLRDQGISPSSLHRNQRLGLPCGGPECEYMDWHRTGDSSELLIGHLSHAYVPEVIQDRVVIIDEDPEDAFQTRFTATELHQLTRDFLMESDELPAKDLDTLKLLRQRTENFEDAREKVLEYAGDIGRVELGRQILESGQGHVDVADTVRALLAPKTEDPEGEEPWRLVLDNGVEYIQLEDSEAAYDPESGELALRQTPNFSETAALVGLDGTPTKELWKGRLGVEQIERDQILCEECRRKYLQETLEYHLIQTTPYIKPYSGASSKRIAFEKDRGLLHEVDRVTEGQIGLITTKRVKDDLLEYKDRNQISLPDRLINHYRNIKGSNEFEGDEVNVGVVIGSPHPGPNELRLLAGLNGDCFETKRVEETRDGHHYSRREPTPEAEPYLMHVRENSVIQAILRFGRRDGATVFVHTSALPDWIRPMCKDSHVSRRSKGEQAVIRALCEVGDATTSEIAEQTDFSSDTVRNHLQALIDEDVVDRGGNGHRIIWQPKDVASDVSPTIKAFSIST